MKNIVITSLSCILLTSCVSDGTPISQQAATILKSDIGSQIFSTVRPNDVRALGQGEIAAGLKQALQVGTDTVVAQLGARNGFNGNPYIRIPLPSALQRVNDALSAVGMGSLTQDLELKLNRAAEMATPRAKALFMDAITQMTFADAKQILTGPNNAATQYLRSTMSGKLADEMRPIIGSTLELSGAVQAYNQVIGRYQALPLMPDVKANLNNYVVAKTLDGIFKYVATEESAIRTNPTKRTTELLQKVFSATQN